MKTQVLFLRGRRTIQEEMLNRFWWMTACFFFLLSRSLSIPLDWELNRSLSELRLSGCRAVWVPELCVCASVSVSLGLRCRPRGEGRWGLPWCQFLL